DILRRRELPFLDFHLASGSARLQKQVCLPAEKRWNLHNIGYLGCGNGLCRLVNIGEYSVTCALHSRQYPNPVFESWAAKPGKAGPVRFIKGSLEDEGAGDFV